MQLTFIAMKLTCSVWNVCLAQLHILSIHPTVRIPSVNSSIVEQLKSNLKVMQCSLLCINLLNPFAARPKKNIIPPKTVKTANTAGDIISYTTVISIAYLASPGLSDTLGIIFISSAANIQQRKG